MSGPASVEGCPELPPHYARLFAIAERDARRAVGLAQRWQAQASAAPPFERALAAYALGYAWLRWERLAEAAPLFAEARAAFAALGEQRLVLHVERAQLFMALLRGGDADHASAWAATAAACAAAGDALAAARARLGQIVQLNVQGAAAEALALIEQIAPLLAAQGSAGDRAWLDRLQGVACTDEAAFAEALRYLARAEARFHSLGQRGECAKTWFEQARTYERCGDIARAQAYTERAAQAARRLDLPFRVAICTKNLGWFATLCGAYDRALYLLLQAQAQLAALGRNDYVAGCDLNLGNLAYSVGIWPLALMAYCRAERVYRALGYERMSMLCQRNQAYTLYQDGQHRAALRVLGALLVRAEALDDRLELAEAWLARGEVLVALKQPSLAEQEFLRAQQMFEQLDTRMMIGECLLQRGWLHLAAAAFVEADTCLHAAHPLLAEQPIYLWRVEYGLARSAAARDDIPAARARYRQACTLIATLRQRLVNEHASSGLFQQARTLVEEAILFAWRFADPAEVLGLAEIQRTLAFSASLRAAQIAVLQQALPEARAVPPALTEEDRAHDPAYQQELQDYLEQRLRRAPPPPSTALELPTHLDLAQVRADFARAFPAGWTLLVYVHCAEQLLTVIVEPARLRLVATPFDKELQELLRQATSAAHRERTYYCTERGAQAWPILSALGERLLPADICAQLQPAQRLLIIANGPLHGLSWPALRWGGRWLAEQTTPQLLPGIIIWQQLLTRRPASDDALLLGISQFGARAPALAGVQPTLERVSARWPGRVECLTEAAASRAALLERARRGELRHYGIIHFATHGHLVAASGLLAHLKLADSDLHYDDILALGLGGALVVLAACEGAATEVLPGEVLLSLSHAFLTAGARDVIGSIWRIFDNTAPELFDLLYAELAAGHDPAQALTLAQRTWLARYRADQTQCEPFATPFVWASLSALGAGTGVSR